jgi:hexosaminidase
MNLSMATPCHTPTSQSDATPRNSPHSSATCEERPHLLHKLSVHVASPCDGRLFPSETSNESYSLEVKCSGAVIKAEEVWGALKGLETFR